MRLNWKASSGYITSCLVGNQPGMMTDKIGNPAVQDKDYEQPESNVLLKFKLRSGLIGTINSMIR
jgi:hypothetical protein